MPAGRSFGGEKGPHLAPRYGCAPARRSDARRAGVLATAALVGRGGLRLGWPLPGAIVGANLVADLAPRSAPRPSSSHLPVAIDAVTIVWPLWPSTPTRFCKTGPYSEGLAAVEAQPWPAWRAHARTSSKPSARPCPSPAPGDLRHEHHRSRRSA